MAFIPLNIKAQETHAQLEKKRVHASSTIIVGEKRGIAVLFSRALFSGIDLRFSARVTPIKPRVLARDRGADDA